MPREAKRYGGFTAADIAEVSGANLQNLRREIAAGHFDPDNLLDLSTFVVSHCLRRGRGLPFQEAGEVPLPSSPATVPTPTPTPEAPATTSRHPSPFSSIGSAPPRSAGGSGRGFRMVKGVWMDD